LAETSEVFIRADILRRAEEAHSTYCRRLRRFIERRQRLLTSRKRLLLFCEAALKETTEPGERDRLDVECEEHRDWVAVHSDAVKQAEDQWNKEGCGPLPSVDIIEAVCYTSYVRGQAGGKGHDRDYRIFYWVDKDKANEPETLKYEERLFYDTFTWLEPPPGKPPIAELDWGRTVREDSVAADDLPGIQEWCYGMIIKRATKEEPQRILYKGERRVDEAGWEALHKNVDAHYHLGEPSLMEPTSTR
jgi:hypothetical protein